MPKGPKGQKRPADVIRNAVKVTRIATGEDEDETPQPTTYKKRNFEVPQSIQSTLGLVSFNRPTAPSLAETAATAFSSRILTVASPRNGKCMTKLLEA